MNQEKKTYPLKQIKDFFNQNREHIPRKDFWINEYTQYHDLVKSIRIYINIMESDTFDEKAKEAAFEHLKNIKLFITLYKANPYHYEQLNARKKDIGTKVTGSNRITG